MRNKTFALLLALILTAGGIGAAGAGERGGNPPHPKMGRSAPGKDGGHDSPRRFPGRFRDPGRGMRGGHGFGTGMGFGPGMWSRLELDAGQKAKLLDVMTANYRAMLEARMAMQDANRKLQELRKADSPDADAIIAANRDLGEARGKMEALGIKARGDFEAVLTPDQREKLKSFRASSRRHKRCDDADDSHDEDDFEEVDSDGQ